MMTHKANDAENLPWLHTSKPGSVPHLGPFLGRLGPLSGFRDPPASSRGRLLDRRDLPGATRTQTLFELRQCH